MLDWKEVKAKLGETITEKNAVLYYKTFIKAFLNLDKEIIEELINGKPYPTDRIEEILISFRKQYPVSNRIQFANEEVKTLYFDEYINDRVSYYHQLAQDSIKMTIEKTNWQIERTLQRYELYPGAWFDLDKKSSERFKPILSYKDAWERFTKIDSLRRFCHCLFLFNRRFGSKPTLKAYEDSLQELEDFIKGTESINLNDAFESMKDDWNPSHAYLKLSHKFYETKWNNSSKTYHEPCEFFGRLDYIIFGKYFLFRNWLKQQIEKGNYTKEGIIIDDEFLNEQDLEHLQIINRHLDEIDDKLTPINRENLKETLMEYFTFRQFPIRPKPINFRGEKGKIRVGFQLYQIWVDLNSQGSDFTKAVDYLSYWKANTNLFRNDFLDKNDVLNSQLYKNFTKKPHKKARK
jgi:hypothetical protein